MGTLLDPAECAGRVFTGAWEVPAGGTVDVLEPATGQRLLVAGLAGPADVDAAVRRAIEAGSGWQDTPPVERAALLRRVAALLTAHREEVVEWLIREGGGVRGKAEYETGSVLDELWVAAALPTQPHGSLLPADAGQQSIARRVPVGVVAVISPWNVPMLLAMRAVAPAIALGNTVILKPDVNTPVSGGYLIARLFAEAGLPAGVLQVLPGDAVPGEALTRHPDVDMVAFTGSSEVGRRVGAAAGGTLKRVSLELGGNNALVVLDDADLDLAASAGAWASFFHQGQVCMSAGRHIVVESVADEYLDRLVKRAEGLRVGDPWREAADLGPMINAAQLHRVDRIVSDSVAAGAVLRTGGTHDGPYYRPTVLAAVPPQCPAFREEIFGPVAPVTVVADADEAVRVAGDTDMGLTAAIQTGSAERGLALAARIRTAIVHVNDQTINDNAYVPFGGRGSSGNGSRYGAAHSWDEFTQWQWITVRDVPARYPF
nr:benzaldehyde dehydrogenase [Verrucosispora sp.]